MSDKQTAEYHREYQRAWRARMKSGELGINEKKRIEKRKNSILALYRQQLVDDETRLVRQRKMNPVTNKLSTVIYVDGWEGGWDAISYLIYAEGGRTTPRRRTE
jgi:hypothetical protein